VHWVNQEFIKTASRFQASSENIKSQISTSSKIREYKIQNLDYEQDSRMKKCLDFRARLPLHISFQASIKQGCKFCLPTKQESSKTTAAREGSIKNETRVLTPKSLRSRISSKVCVQWPWCWALGIWLPGHSVAPPKNQSNGTLKNIASQFTVK
jgi:hypothetical protein